MSVIGEAALAVFLELLFSKLATSAIDFVNSHKLVGEQLKQWQSILPDIQAVLDDAEEKQIKDDRVKSWLADLQDLAYDVDDILDEFAYEELRVKLQKTQVQASTSKIRKLIPTCCTSSNFTPTAFVFNNKMVSKIKEITARFDDLASRKSRLELRQIPGASAGRVSKGIKPSLQPTSLVDESVVYVGREQEKGEIIELLKSSDGSRDGVSVISIVGMGGLGKTTLAQLVYNDTDLQKSFDLNAWVCVSDDFDATTITKRVLASIAPGSSVDSDLCMLQVKLKEMISGKRFLLVLDDIWNEDYNDWTILRAPFGAGTKIIVTTRSEYVSRIVDPVKSIYLNKLSDDDCLSIITQHAFGKRDFKEHPEFMEAGETIAKRCDGLALAAKTLGGLLRKHMDPNQWKSINESKIWELTEEHCGNIPALQLSYHHLPAHLKRCFAYCSIVPKDYEFEKEELILLWRADGFLQQTDKRQSKDIGSQYFDDLEKRSFFQASSTNESRFVMHDLINDLAQSVAGEICSKLEGKQQKFTNRTRHCSYVAGSFDGKKKFEAFDEVKHLRTFLPLPLPDYWRDYNLTNVVVDALLPRLEYLRVLSLGGYGSITKLPNNLFEKFKHLRYLNFSFTSIYDLPDSVSTLYHLETLILRHCYNLEKLPSEIGNLSKLNYLDIKCSNQIRKIPFGIVKLIGLHRLSDFIVGEDKEDGIQNIGNLSHLSGDFCISSLENITKAEDARKANLSGKLGIRGLELKWKYDFDGRNAETEEKVLDSLHPYKELNKLYIENYMGVKLSSWIGNSSFTSLSSLKLINCKSCKSLPSIGRLPQLKHVLIKGMDEVTNVGDESFGENQSLETLHFEGLENWKEWDCGEQQDSKFPILRELSLKNCPRLEKQFPNNLPSLQKLEIHRCERLVVSITNLPLISELEIDGCKELRYSVDVEYALLKYVRLSNISQEREGFVHDLSSSSSLETKAEEVEDEKLLLEKFSSVESLTIDNCQKCARLCSKLPKVVHSFKFITELMICNCSRLVSLSEFNFPPALKELQIRKCENLQCLVKEREYMGGSLTSCLLPQHLGIEKCDSLAYLSSRDDVAVHLGHFHISKCPKLTRLFLNGKLPKKLKELEIWECPELESIALDFEEATCLERIDISVNGKMKSLPRGLDKLSRLQDIHFYSCSSLVGVCEEDESWSPSQLRELHIDACPKFEALPRSINKFTSLRSLREVGCISSVENGLPTNLTNLSITLSSQMLRSIVKWGFHRFSCLRKLRIVGEELSDVTSIPEEGMLELMCLPPPLTSITIIGFKNLRCISWEIFHNLTSLEELYIWSCPKLISLPEKRVLLSLGQLSIFNCPLLEQELERDEGREWLKNAAHIPFLNIHRSISENPRYTFRPR